MAKSPQAKSKVERVEKEAVVVQPIEKVKQHTVFSPKLVFVKKKFPPFFQPDRLFREDAVQVSIVENVKVPAKVQAIKYILLSISHIFSLKNKLFFFLDC